MCKASVGDASISVGVWKQSFHLLLLFRTLSGYFYSYTNNNDLRTAQKNLSSIEEDNMEMKFQLLYTLRHFQ